MTRLKRLFVVLDEVHTDTNNPLLPKTIYGGMLHFDDDSDKVIITRKLSMDLPWSEYHTTKQNLQVCESMTCNYLWMIVRRPILGRDELMGPGEKIEAKIVVRGRDLTITAYPYGWTRVFDADVICEMHLRDIPLEIGFNAIFNLPNEFDVTI